MVNYIYYCNEKPNIFCSIYIHTLFSINIKIIYFFIVNILYSIEIDYKKNNNVDHHRLYKSENEELKITSYININRGWCVCVEIRRSP